MKTVGVIGTGTMGCGIAQVASQIRCEVVFQNRRQESVDRGLGRIRKSVEKLVARNKLSDAQGEGVLERIGCTFAGCVAGGLEAIPQNLQVTLDLELHRHR